MFAQLTLALTSLLGINLTDMSVLPQQQTADVECIVPVVIDTTTATDDDACVIEALQSVGMSWVSADNPGSVPLGVQIYQAQFGLTVDGVVSPQTALSLGIWDTSTTLGERVVAAALTQEGVPYRKNTAIPGVGFDCSGLTSWAWGNVGIELPRNSSAQSRIGTEVEEHEAIPGDLLWYPGHIALYIGDGQMIHAVKPGTPARVQDVNWSMIRKVVRPVEDPAHDLLHAGNIDLPATPTPGGPR
jgi:hypothetical protein